MKMQSYYTNALEDSNKRVDDKPLFVNCTGACVIEKNFKTKNDKGRQDYYLLYLYKGKMNLGINEENTVISSGQLIVIPPDTPFCYDNEGTSAIEYLWVHFSGFNADNLLEKTCIECNKILTVGFDERIIEYFMGLFSEYAERDIGFEMSCVSRLIAICVLFGRCINKSSLNDTVIDLSASLNYIYKNFNTEIRVDSLAEMEHLSTGYYRNLFKRQTGMSPIDYIIEIRICHSRELLSNTNLSIKEISSMVGYEDQLYFCRLFKKKTELTPKKYRQS